MISHFYRTFFQNALGAGYSENLGEIGILSRATCALVQNGLCSSMPVCYIVRLCSDVLLYNRVLKHLARKPAIECNQILIKPTREQPHQTSSHSPPHLPPTPATTGKPTLLSSLASKSLHSRAKNSPTTLLILLISSLRSPSPAAANPTAREEKIPSGQISIP